MSGTRLISAQKALTAELHRLGHEARLESGDGYFYFLGLEPAAWLDKTVKVPKVSSPTLGLSAVLPEGCPSLESLSGGYTSSSKSRVGFGRSAGIVQVDFFGCAVILPICADTDDSSDGDKADWYSRL